MQAHPWCVQKSHAPYQVLEMTQAIAFVVLGSKNTHLILLATLLHRHPLYFVKKQWLAFHQN